MLGSFDFHQITDPHKPTKFYINLEKNEHLRRAPVKNVILFVNARDEKNIKEWVAHHLLIGFSMVYIFDHKSKVPLKEVFKKFDRRVIVERCELNGPPKIPLMSKASEIAARMRADWFIYLDADEFIILNKFRGVKDMLNRYHFADSLALNWVMFGTNNHIKDPEGLLLENYTKSDLKFNQHVKTFVRPTQVACGGPMTPHNYYIVNPMRSFAITGSSMTKKVFNPTNKVFWKTPAFIAHYIYQSEETYKERKIKLPADDSGNFRKEENNIHSLHNETDNFIPRKYADNIKAFLKQYE
jgi:hypothetical protein